MFRKIIFIVAFIAGGACQGYTSQAHPETGIVEKLGSYLPMDAELYDESGNLVTLGSVLNKPTIITFVYYECPGICTPLLMDVSKVVDNMSLVPGEDYRILTISFDDRETPEMAASKKENFLSQLKRTIDPSGWRFFTGDSANIYRLTGAAGFYFKRDREMWIHPTTLIAVSPKGKITRYLYGVNQLPMDVKLAIMEASAGTTGPTIAKVLNFCFAYDPVGKHYVFNIVRVSVLIILLLTGLFVYFFLIRARKVKRSTAQ
jgi:protein SCO1/2